MYRVWGARESDCCKRWKFANINLFCTMSAWEPRLVHLWKTTVSPMWSFVIAFHQNLLLHVKIWVHKSQWRDAPWELTGVYREPLWNASPVSGEAQGWSTHCCYISFYSLFLEYPADAAWTQHCRTFSFTCSRQEKVCSFLPKPCHTTQSYRGAAWVSTSSVPALRQQLFQQGSKSSCFICTLTSLSCCLTAGSLLL